MHELCDARNLGSAALYALLAAAAVTAVAAAIGDSRTKSAEKSAEAAARLGVPLVLTVVPLLPASHLLVPVGTVIAERLLYLPSAGLCVGAGCWAGAVGRAAATAAAAAAAADSPAMKPRSASRRYSRRLAAGYAVCLGLGAFGVMSRNAEWADGDSISIASARSCPTSAKAQLSLGTARRYIAEIYSRDI